jgi:hypothetical protein
MLPFTASTKYRVDILVSIATAFAGLSRLSSAERQTVAPIEIEPARPVGLLPDSTP